MLPGIKKTNIGGGQNASVSVTIICITESRTLYIYLGSSVCHLEMEGLEMQRLKREGVNRLEKLVGSQCHLQLH